MARLEDQYKVQDVVDMLQQMLHGGIGKDMFAVDFLPDTHNPRTGRFMVHTTKMLIASTPADDLRGLPAMVLRQLIRAHQISQEELQRLLDMANIPELPTPTLIGDHHE